MEDKFKLKKILVSLDLSVMDEVLIRIASYIASVMHSDRVYFMHIAEELDLPNELREKWGNVLAPADEQLVHSLKYRVREHFKPVPKCDTVVEVHEGNVTDKLLKLLNAKNIDLLVVGNRQARRGGTISDTVMKAANRSVLLVPEVLPRQMDKVLVPIDFSDHSLWALQQDIKIQKNSDLPLEIKCQHVYELPSGWHSTGKSEQEFSDIMRKHAEENAQKFMQKLPPEYRDIPFVFTRDDNHDPVQEIYHQAVLEQADLIIIGSKGKSAAAAVLMGSVADRLAQFAKNIPVLIVKDRNENIGFLQALLKI
ncbi:MAG: universal stress protein [Bacteroidetes bacterium]|nr:universal stress protein [Bacteroidota bacterium]